MKIFMLCLIVVSHTLAAPGARKRDIDFYTYHQLHAVPVESITHYCPEQDIPAKFIPSPPEIQNFPLPSLPNLPIIRYEAPIPIHVAPVHHDYFLPAAPFHPEYLPPPRQHYLPAPIVPQDTYGAPFLKYGPPEYREETTTTTTLPPPTESTTLPLTYLPPTAPPTYLPPTEPPTYFPPTEPPTVVVTYPPKFHKLALIKQHLKKNLLPEIQFRPTLVLSKKIEFPILKNLFGHHH